MDEDEVPLFILLGEYLAIVLIKPAMDGVLVENWILDFQLQLVA